MKFNYYLPTNFIFGRGRVKEVGAIAKEYGKKVLIVTGTNSTKKTGLLNRTIQYLENEGMDICVFDQVTQNPLTTTVEDGVKQFHQGQCDLVIGLGGGSIMDCAKAIAFFAKNEGDMTDYIFARKISDQAYPLILIPTTCGTGSEGNGFAVLTNPENGDKKSLRCNAIIAKASIIDSELMETMPKSILASVGFDAFCHAMEAYLSRIGQPMTDQMAIRAMELIGNQLVNVYHGIGGGNAWDEITWASTLGGMVIHSAGVTLPHGMEHPASGLRNIVHGRGLAALTPIITEASLSFVPNKYEKISQCIGGKGVNDCVDRMNNLLEEIELKTTLSQQGITEEDVPWMIENCFKVSEAGIKNHPYIFQENEIKELYIKSL